MQRERLTFQADGFRENEYRILGMSISFFPKIDYRFEKSIFSIIKFVAR